ncbi:hypothetical protein, partial [Burkholderia pseudomallei]|uniref:hypothetical protein n=1 Tax=Burkholderia pseudomallei TaxID=28450 RepID=UPI001F18C6DA
MGRVTKLPHHRFGLRNGFELGATCIEKQRAYGSEDLEFGLLTNDLVREGGSDVPDFMALDQRKNFIDGHILVTSFMALAQCGSRRVT